MYGNHGLHINPNTDDYVNQLHHLTAQQKEDLKAVLNTYTKLFDGTQGVYPHQKIHIDFVEGAVLKHARLYPVATIHLDVFKKELLYLVDIGVCVCSGFWSQG